MSLLNLLPSNQNLASQFSAKSRFFGILLLGALAIIGNVFGVTLFFGVDFIFGGIAAMLALLLFGTLPAVFVAIIGGAYTIILWNHPYALLIFTFEAAFVGLLHRRMEFDLALADLAYWLLIGIPMISFIYSGFVGTDGETTILIAMKQSINGLFNALLAGILFLGLIKLWGELSNITFEKIHLTNLFFHVLLAAILIAGTIPIIHESHYQRYTHESFLGENLAELARHVANKIQANPETSPEDWQRTIDETRKPQGISLAFISKDNKILFTYGDAPQLLSPKGQLKAQINGFSLRLPPNDTPNINRWKQGQYRFELPVNNMQDISRIIIEQPAKDIVETLGHEQLTLFIYIGIFFMVSIFSAYFLSQMLARAPKELEHASKNLAAHIAGGVRPSLPASVFYEYNSLRNTLKVMADSLAIKFHELQQSHSNLENLVDTRVAELRESEERFVFAVEGAGDGVWELEIKTGLMKYSANYEQMLGYNQGEISQNFDEWIKIIHPEEQEYIERKLQDYLAGRIPAYEVEMRLRCKDDTYKWILCRGTTAENRKNGEPIRMIGIHTDIEDRKNKEQEVLLAKQEAEQANRAKSEFLSSMSHELRTPMNAILGFSQLLEMEDLNEIQQDNVKEIRKAGDYLLVLINEVLDLARIEAGRIDLSIEPIPLVNLIEECISFVLPLAEKKNINIRTDWNSENNIIVRADGTRLRQVLLNLLSNAVKYNHPDGAVYIDSQATKDCSVIIKIKDTGFGISQEDQAELFTAFSRLGDRQTEIEGTGIGLMITKNLVELMGGNIGVESSPGEGSTFWITLPADQTVPTGKNSYKSIKPDKPEPASGDNFRILYIEDNPSNIMLINRLLGNRKHISLHTAHTPQLGLDLIAAQSFDLIMLDINLPGMDGYKVLEKIRSHKTTKDIPVFALSANAMDKDIEKGIAAGFDKYLTKPININTFYRTIDDVLDLKPDTN